jgi:Uma2 family endonuclease
MAHTSTKPIDFEQYLTYDDGTDIRHELVDGELIAMPPAVYQHYLLAKLLERCFDREISRLSKTWNTGRGDIGIRTQGRKGYNTRLPDVVVFEAESVLDLQESAILTSVPLLVVEIVSSNWKDDYDDKLREYQALGIPEYWIADYNCKATKEYLGNPKLPTLFVNLLGDRKYHKQAFRGDNRIISQLFPEIDLTAAQALGTEPLSQFIAISL